MNSAASKSDLYQDAWRLTQDMLAAARARDWERLVELERRRDRCLAGIGQDGMAGSDSVEQISQYIRHILQADKEIMQLTQGWMGELKGLLHSVGNEKKLHDAYDVG